GGQHRTGTSGRHGAARGKVQRGDDPGRFHRPRSRSFAEGLRRREARRAGDRGRPHRRGREVPSPPGIGSGPVPHPGTDGVLGDLMPKELRSDRRDDIFKEYVIARVEKSGEKFEILVKPEAVQKVRDGKDVDLLKELAIEEAKVHTDPFKPIEEQVKEVLDALRPLIPIRFEKVRIAVKLSAEDSAKSYGDIKGYGTILKEEWSPTGAWLGVVEMPAGL